MSEYETWEKQHTKCSACSRFFRVDGVSEREPYGQCRAKAPSLGGWPVVSVDDSCGEFTWDFAERYRLYSLRAKALHDPVIVDGFWPTDRRER